MIITSTPVLLHVSFPDRVTPTVPRNHSRGARRVWPLHGVHVYIWEGKNRASCPHDYPQPGPGPGGQLSTTYPLIHKNRGTNNLHSYAYLLETRNCVALGGPSTLRSRGGPLPQCIRNRSTEQIGARRMPKPHNAGHVPFEEIEADPRPLLLPVPAGDR